MLKKILMIASAGLLSVSAFAQRQRVMTKEDSLVRRYQSDASTPEGMKAARQKINELANANSEKDLALAIRIAGTIKQSALADSLNKVDIKRYPNGHAAMIEGYSDINNTHGSGAKLQAMYEAWIKKFPEPAVNPDVVYDYARTDLASAYAEEKDVKNNALWVSRIKNPSYRGTVQNMVAGIFLTKGDTSTAEGLIREGLENAKSNLAKNENPMAKNEYNTYLVSYASLLFKEKKYKKALTPIVEAYNGSENKSAGLKDTYSLILAANGRGKEVMPYLEEVIKSGKNSRADVNALKSAYIQDKGNATGFDAYMASLNDVMKESVHARLTKEMIDQKAPSFSLVDLDGKKVSLDELKGKVVILDFWATWCGPCKKSFPAMQMALNKYKNDANVKFLFIDTWERMADPKPAVKGYVTDNKYSFHVLLDNKETKVVDNYGISGIPAKFVIDGNGKIRFKLTGFDGSDDAAVEEISAMIEMTKKQ